MVLRDWVFSLGVHGIAVATLVVVCRLVPLERAAPEEPPWCEVVPVAVFETPLPALPAPSCASTPPASVHPAPAALQSPAFAALPLAAPPVLVSPAPAVSDAVFAVADVGVSVSVEPPETIAGETSADADHSVAPWGTQDLSAVAPSLPPQLQGAPPKLHYPETSRAHNEEGRVWVAVYVNAQGVVSNVAVVATSGFAALDRAACDAARKARFLPARIKGVAADGVARIPFDFRLR